MEVGLTVGPEVDPLSKALPAMLASEGLFARVNQPVHGQAIGSGKGLSTLWASVTSLSFVD